MKWSEFVLNHNPIDAMIHGSRKELPVLMKEFLATSNPRPAGLICRHVLTPLKPWPWDNLSDIEWRAEMKHNSGLLIAVLLRLNRTGNNESFLSLFDSLESEYRAAKKRFGWLKRAIGTPEKHLNQLLSGLKSDLKELEISFVDWATDNRDLIISELKFLLENDDFVTGNATKDLERWTPGWWKKNKEKTDTQKKEAKDHV
jgi:hypothetical protein